MNKKSFIVLLMVIFIVSLFSISLAGKNDLKVPKKVLKLEKKADKAKNKKDFVKAIELYKNAIDIFPDYYKVHYKLASIYAFNNKYPEAIAELKIAKKLNNTNINIIKALSDTMLKYGNSLFKSKKLKDANNVFIDMLNIDGFKKTFPKLQNRMIYRIGLNYFSLRDIKNSEKYLSRFINIENAEKDYPKFFSMANYISGINNSTIKNYDLSNKLLKKYITLNSDDLKNKYISFARYIIASNDFSVLKPMVTEIKKTTNRKNIKENKIKIKELAEKYIEIEKNLNEVILRSPSIEDAYVILGNYYYLKNDTKNCLKIYRTLIERFPKSKDIDIYKEFLKGLLKTK